MDSELLLKMNLKVNLLVFFFEYFLLSVTKIHNHKERMEVLKKIAGTARIQENKNLNFFL